MKKKTVTLFFFVIICLIPGCNDDKTVYPQIRKSGDTYFIKENRKAEERPLSSKDLLARSFAGKYIAFVLNTGNGPQGYVVETETARLYAFLPEAAPARLVWAPYSSKLLIEYRNNTPSVAVFSFPTSNLLLSDYNGSLYFWMDDDLILYATKTKISHPLMPGGSEEAPALQLLDLKQKTDRSQLHKPYKVSDFYNRVVPMGINQGKFFYAVIAYPDRYLKPYDKKAPSDPDKARELFVRLFAKTEKEKTVQLHEVSGTVDRKITKKEALERIGNEALYPALLFD